MIDAVWEARSLPISEYAVTGGNVPPHEHVAAVDHSMPQTTLLGWSQSCRN